jgi:signal transduction histidine kinase
VVRPRATILVKLLAAFALPTVALFGLFAYVAHEVARGDLDDELGERLTALAASAAPQIRGKYVPDPDDDRGRQNALRKLEPISAATGVRLFILGRAPDPETGRAGFVSWVDTRPDGAAPGTPAPAPAPAPAPTGGADGIVDAGAPDPRVAVRRHFRADLDRVEIAAVLADGAPRSSVTFEGNDGAMYKAGYAAIHASETEPEIVLVLGAEAPATYFKPLSDLRDTLFLWGGALTAVVLAATFLAALLLTRNVRRLAAAAEAIGAGNLRTPIAVRSRDEFGVLGETMDRMRGQLAERDARMQQMLAGIAHEVRNPLAGMTLFTGILKDDLPDGDERRGHVDKIARELGYLERVVNDFLEYARRPKPELGDVPVGELLAEVAQMSSTPAIEVAVAPAEVLARADRGQLRRAVLNLARNAVQAATAAGHSGADAVRLGGERRGDQTRITVWNRGVEISPETSGKLFEPFFTTREKGTGLGLAFVREIVADHGGTVEVESAGGETTFTIVLPA